MTAVNRAVGADIGAAPQSSATCRFCGAWLTRTFVDLGMSPLCETYPARGELNRMEAFYPLHVYVCDACLLVQLEEVRESQRDLQRVRLLLFVLRQLAPPRPVLRRGRG